MCIQRGYHKVQSVEWTQKRNSWFKCHISQLLMPRIIVRGYSKVSLVFLTSCHQTRKSWGWLNAMSLRRFTFETFILSKGHCFPSAAIVLTTVSCNAWHLMANYSSHVFSWPTLLWWQHWIFNVLCTKCVGQLLRLITVKQSWSSIMSLAIGVTVSSRTATAFVYE